MEKRPLVPRLAEAHHPASRRFLIIRNDNCINCGTCVSACPYECHHRSADDPRIMDTPEENCCRRCFSCVLRCPRQALELKVDSRHTKLGDAAAFTPAVIVALQEQAADGRVPVSGSGYGGRFDGPGFDGIWTDMSEIVRPTRDGIHGREHISTAITLGRKISNLSSTDFDRQGHLSRLIPATRELPIPILFGLPPFPVNQRVYTALAMAASKLQTLFTIRPQDLESSSLFAGEPTVMDYFNHLIIALAPSQIEQYQNILTWASMVQIDSGPGQLEALRCAKAINSTIISILRVSSTGADLEHEVVELARSGAEVIHLQTKGTQGDEPGKVLIKALTSVHRALVEAGLRDRISLVISGDIAMAEHVPKAIILGADGVVIDIPLLIALECTVCGECLFGNACPSALGQLDESWSKKEYRGEDYIKWASCRVVNLILSWRDQLLEVLGAMGLRDIRRLRGETGRAIFADQARDRFRSQLAMPAKVPDIVSPDVAVPSLTSACKAALQRFPNYVGRWIVEVDRDICTDCGLCVNSCKVGVHRRVAGKAVLEEPLHWRCLGEKCKEENSWCCLSVCPDSAISLREAGSEQVLGDFRWTPQLLRETYAQATSGQSIAIEATESLGNSGGGFDLLRFNCPSVVAKVLPEEVDLSIALNRRTDFPVQLRIPVPFYGGGMSYGSISLAVMLGRAMAAKQIGTFTSTGEGGYPEQLVEFKDNVITQIATGLFGVREETIQRARLVEFKYAQGAKPGLGGHLLAEKNTITVAKLREAVPGTGLFSPFPFHSVYSVEDHKKHLDWVRAIHPEVLLSVKVSTPADVDMVAVGSFYAGANIINLDGGYGGTGAAPDIAKKNIAMPIEYAISRVHDFLLAEGIRDQVTLIAGGGIRSADDLLKAVALGANGAAIGTAELVAIDCVRCGNCERGRGCPIGIASTDPTLASQLESGWVASRISNMYRAWTGRMRTRLASFGMRSIHELVGRRDLVRFFQESQL